jgi:uncharacterized membrane protein HdeD (DUF308 family)
MEEGAFMAAGLESGYPVRFSVDYPEEGLDRIRTAFRIILALPVLVLVSLIGGGYFDVWTQDQSNVTWALAGGILAIPTALMIVVRQKYPRWWFDWNLELLRFSNRVAAYLFLLRDEYPSTDEEQAVHLDIPYPDVERDLNRWLPLVKWLLAIPHYIVLFFLFIGVIFAVIIAWFAILFTGRYPPGLFGFVVDAIRWEIRVTAYTAILTTDKYPPFTLGQ